MRALKKNVLYCFSNNLKNYYKILDVPSSASVKDIKKKYNLLVKQYHPDVNPNHTNFFKDINEAYSILSKAEERRKYDQRINPRSETNNEYNKGFNERGRQYDSYYYTVS